MRLFLDLRSVMQLTVRDVAEIFNVSEKSIYRWLKKGLIPAYRVRDQYRFNRAELLEWATANRVSFKRDIYSSSEEPEFEHIPRLSEALKIGGIHYEVPAENRESALRAVVGVIGLPESVDREALLKTLLAREDMASTGIGDGIAIPHVRNPIVLGVDFPLVSLSFLQNPVEFGALDGKLVHCLFVLITPSTKCHLYLISRLAFALTRPEFRTAIVERAGAGDIMWQLLRAEAAINEAKSKGSGGMD
jgi:PTS system nitrogen regulatory IIA component